MPKNKKVYGKKDGGISREAYKRAKENKGKDRVTVKDIEQEEKTIKKMETLRGTYKRAKENKGSDRLTTKDVEDATERSKLLDARRPYIGAERRGDRLTNSVNKKGGGIASKGMGAAYKGGGMATRGMGKAYLANQGSKTRK